MCRNTQAISKNVNIDIQVFTKVFIVQHSNSNHVFEDNHSHYKHTLKVYIFRSTIGSILKPITKYINTFVVNHNSFIHKKYLVGQMTFPLSTYCTLVIIYDTTKPPSPLNFKQNQPLGQDLCSLLGRSTDQCDSITFQVHINQCYNQLPLFNTPI
jgi:hypothetical protein